MSGGKGQDSGAFELQKLGVARQWMTYRPWQIVKLSMERDGLRAQNLSLKRELDQVKANLAGQEDYRIREER